MISGDFVPLLMAGLLCKQKHKLVPIVVPHQCTSSPGTAVGRGNRCTCRPGQRGPGGWTRKVCTEWWRALPAFGAHSQSRALPSLWCTPRAFCTGCCLYWRLGESQYRAAWTHSKVASPRFSIFSLDTFAKRRDFLLLWFPGNPLLLP